MAQHIMRLSPLLLKQINDKLGGSAMTKVTPQTTELMAAFQLGVQHVLRIIESEFTVEDSGA